MVIEKCLKAVHKEVILTFINRTIQNCAIMGKGPVYIDNISIKEDECFIIIQYFEDVKEYVEPFIKLFNEENDFYKRSLQIKKKVR